MHSFLMIGQSNMAGRGAPNEVEPIQNGCIYVLRNGIFRPMYVPVNPDRVSSGINLAESFADAYQKHNRAIVGLIPCADGGSALDQWREGEILFDHACYQTELATRNSELKGILWHQGEADCSEELYPSYFERLSEMLDALRRRLGMPDIPILLGGLGDFLAKCELSDALKNYTYINEALRRAAEQKKNCGFVSAEGLGANSDNLHFSAAALREFGVRYFEEFLRIQA